MTRAGEVDRNYFDLVKPQGIAAEAFALRNETAEARRVLAYGATRGRLQLDDLYEALRKGTEVDLNAEWAARLARVVGWQNFYPEDRKFAIVLFERVLKQLRASKGLHLALRRDYLKLLIAEDRFDAAWDFLAADSTLQANAGPDPWIDLYSPFTTSQRSDREEWSRRFSAQFDRHGLAKLDVRDGEGDPFDRVEGDWTELTGNYSEHLVTVIMTTFRPAREPLLAAVQSILRQTWRRFELIVIDDASPAEYGSLLQYVSDLDERIRVERMPTNGGTYLARNRALELAQGVFFTNQDADDWSHPQRLERQVLPLLSNPRTPATRAAALTVDSKLRLTRPGYGTMQQHAATFMSRVALVRSVGGYLPARRAADNELHRRLEAYTGQRVTEIKEPLALYRIEPDSLSRGDFRAGWSHPARQSFIASYEHWHRSARKKDLEIDLGRARVAVPPRFTVSVRSEPQRYDLVVATDWRFTDPVRRAAHDQVVAAMRKGLRVGVLHMESPVRVSPRRGMLSSQIQGLINDGKIARVLLDETAAISRLLVRDPSVLQYSPITISKLQVSSMDIAVDVSEIDHENAWYTRAECDATSARLFSITPEWALESLSSEPEASGPIRWDTHVAPYVHRPTWSVERCHWRGTVPVVGWLDDSETGAGLDPRSRSHLRVAVGRRKRRLDFRLRAADAVCRSFASKNYASEWTRFRPEDISVRAFLHSVDFVIPTEAQMNAPRAQLEAIASGCVVVAPPHWKPLYGDAALYADPEDVFSTVWDYYNDRNKFEKHLEQSVEYLAALGM